MFAAKQAPSLRQRLKDLKEGHKLGRVPESTFRGQAVEICIALKKLGEEVRSAQAGARAHPIVASNWPTSAHVLVTRAADPRGGGHPQGQRCGCWGVHRRVRRRRRRGDGQGGRACSSGVSLVSCRHWLKLCCLRCDVCTDPFVRASGDGVAARAVTRGRPCKLPNVNNQKLLPAAARHSARPTCPGRRPRSTRMPPSSRCVPHRP